MIVLEKWLANRPTGWYEICTNLLYRLYSFQCFPDAKNWSMLYEWVCHSILDELTGCTSNWVKNAAMDPRTNIFTPGAGHHYLRSQTIAPTQRPYAWFWDRPVRSECQLGLESPPGSKGGWAGPPSTMVLIHPAVAACLMAQMASSVFSQASWASISLALMYERVKTRNYHPGIQGPFCGSWEHILLSPWHPGPLCMLFAIFHNPLSGIWMGWSPPSWSGRKLAYHILTLLWILPSPHDLNLTIPRGFSFVQSVGGVGHETGFCFLHILCFFSTHIRHSPPRGPLENGTPGGSHVGVLRKSRPWYVYSHGVFCTLNLSAAEIRKSNPFFLLIGAIMGNFLMYCLDL